MAAASGQLTVLIAAQRAAGGGVGRLLQGMLHPHHAACLNNAKNEYEQEWQDQRNLDHCRATPICRNPSAKCVQRFHGILTVVLVAMLSVAELRPGQPKMWV